MATSMMRASLLLALTVLALSPHSADAFAVTDPDQTNIETWTVGNPQTVKFTTTISTVSGGRFR
jgi:hypothetical protein